MLFSKNQNVRKTKSQAPRRPTLTAYYRSETNEDKASPFSHKKPRPQARKYLFGLADIILVLVIIAGVSYSLIIKPDPEIVPDSQVFHSSSQYQSAAAAQLRHLSNRNKITFSQSGLASDLKAQFPEIDTVQVELPLFSERPVITLTISKARLFLNSQGRRYVIDSSGKAVALAGGLPRITGLPEITDQSGFKTLPGQQVLSASSVAFIDTVAAQCRRANVPVASLSLPAIPQEMDLKAKDQPYYVKFYLGGDAMTQSGQFLAARKHFSDTHQPPAQYLDVRISGKIFFK